MPFPNARFNPDWKAVHDLHDQGRSRASDQMKRIYKMDAGSCEELALAKADFDRHQDACFQALVSQHRTVQDYAAWLLRDFPLGRDVELLGDVYVPPDFSTMQTVEQVDAAYHHTEQRMETDNRERRGRLATGQPPGLLAFGDARSPKLRSYWREFSGRELDPDGYFSSSGAATLITVDEQVDGWHVCFMQAAEVRGVSVTNCFELLATCIYREARSLAGVSDTHRNPLKRLVRRWTAREHNDRFAPGRFHFYQHSVANQTFPETFDRVGLSFDEGKFHSLEWTGFKLVPQAVQQAREECERAQAEASPPLQLT